MFRKNSIWFVMMVLFMSLVLVACGDNADSNTDTSTTDTSTDNTTETADETVDEPEATDESEEVAETGACAPATDGLYAGVDPQGQTVVWWHNHSAARAEGLATLVQQFNEENECGIIIDSQSQGGYDDIRDKVNASIFAGEAPAALIVGYQNDQAFYQLNDALVDLNTLVYDETWGLTDEDLNDFFGSFFDQSIHPAFDNQRLGFPPNRSMEVLYYNQTWLEELGFDGPPTTPDQFAEMSCAAADANGDGSGGFILRDDASAVAAWTYAFGGDVLDEAGTSYIYNGDATVEAMTFLKDLHDAGCAFFVDGNASPELAARRAIFAMGSSSGIPFYEGDVNTVAEETGYDPDVWGVTAIPHTTDEPVQNVYGGDVMITANAPEQELAAWLFIKWFTSPEVMAEWSRISGYFPTRASSAALLTDYVDESPQWGQALDLLSYSYYEPQLISYQGVRDSAASAFNEIMQGADIVSTLEALTEGANEAQAELMSEVE